MINLTKQEARHIVMMLSEYMALNPEEYIEENINVTDGVTTKTSEIMAKLLMYATEPEESR